MPAPVFIDAAGVVGGTVTVILFVYFQSQQKELERRILVLSWSSWRKSSTSTDIFADHGE